jgi:predicted RNA-binding protein with PIN domain
MSFDRILVDGYSITHAWPDLLKLQRKSLGAARETLVHKLAAYASHSGQRVTVVFDGTNQKQPVLPAPIPNCEVVFSSYGETADDVIERCVASAAEPSRLLVVTDDAAEQLTVQSFGAFAYSADFFRAMVDEELGELARKIRRVQSHAKRQFGRKPL